MSTTVYIAEKIAQSTTLHAPTEKRGNPGLPVLSEEPVA